MSRLLLDQTCRRRPDEDGASGGLLRVPWEVAVPPLCPLGPCWYQGCLAQSCLVWILFAERDCAGRPTCVTTRRRERPLPRPAICSAAWSVLCGVCGVERATQCSTAQY